MSPEPKPRGDVAASSPSRNLQPSTNQIAISVGSRRHAPPRLPSKKSSTIGEARYRDEYAQLEYTLCQIQTSGMNFHDGRLLSGLLRLIATHSMPFSRGCPLHPH
jgi:hypothetical protein